MERHLITMLAIASFALLGLSADPPGSGAQPTFADAHGVAYIVSPGDSSTDIYALHSGGANVEVFGSVIATLPEATTFLATVTSGTEATLNGSVNPDGEGVTECLFEYGEMETYGQTVPCAESPATIGAGTQNVAVHADLSGLSLATTYHYRLVAANGNGTVSGTDASFRTFGPPTISGQWASSVLPTEATLRATINSEGYPTTARLKWGVDTSYGNTSEPVEIRSDSTDHTVSIDLSGLRPDTTYHYRFLAANSISGDLGHPAEGPDRSFTTYPLEDQPGSPEGRAYELVSPTDKNGGDVGGTALGGLLADGLAQSAVDGDAVTYASLTSFGDAQSSMLTTQYLSTRTSAGWTTHSISPPMVLAPRAEDLFEALSPYSFFSADLSRGLLQSREALVSGAPPEFHKLYVQDIGSGAYRLVTPVAPLNKTPADYSVVFAGASPDLRSVVFQANDALLEGAPTSGQSVYEWRADTATLRLVSVLPGPGAEAAASAGAGDGHLGNLANDVSANGSRIFWTDNEEQLYVREDGATTTKINASQRALSLGDGSATYRAATPDGSKVFFTDSTPLTDDPDDQGGLYEYDFEDTSLTNLTPSNGGVPDIRGVIGASDNGRSVYFVAGSVLAPGAIEGEDNLYLVRDGVIELIAVLNEADSGDWSQNLSNRTARVTPDGEHLAFMSDRSLTGFDNTDAATGVPDTEVFLYDAASGLLSCASCNPSGARPIGPSSLPMALESNYLTRYISNDGQRLFFDTGDALLPSDTNGRQDVYEYREGAVHLISSGIRSADSAFSDASPDGRDVFFTTRAQLVPEDRDGNSDLYDARVGGGFPFEAPPVPCSGEACRGPLSAPPTPPGVQTAAGGGYPEGPVSRPRAKRRACRAGGRKARRTARPACKAKSHRSEHRRNHS